MSKKIITIILGAVLIVFLLYTPSIQAQTNTETLSLEQAYQMALANSKDIKQINYEIERSEEVRDSIASQAEYMVAGSASPQPELINGMAAADISLGMTSRQKKVLEEQIQYNVLKKYLNVIIASNNMDYANRNQKYIEKQRYISSLSHEIGNISDFDWQKAKINYQTVNLNLDSTQAGLDKAYLEMNALLGLPSEDRLILTDRPEYKSFTDTIDPAGRIFNIISENPSVWLKERNIELAELQLLQYDWSNPAREPWMAKQIDVDKAELTAVQLKQQLRDSLSSLLKSIEQLEYSYNIQQQSLLSAQKDLEVQRIKYELGMSNKLDLQQLELAVEKAQNDLEQTVCQHELLKLSFLKPWAAQ